MTIPIAIMAVMLLASGAVWCCVLTGRIPRQIESLPPRDAAPRVNYPALALVSYYLFAHLINLVANFGEPRMPDDVSVEKLQDLVAQNLILWALIIGLCFLITETRHKDYGIHFDKWPRQLAIGGLAFLASWLPVFLLLLASSAIRTEETLHPFLQLLKDDQSGQTLLWISLAVILTAPLWEEAAYRVILQTSLARWLPISLAIPLTAILFAGVHGWPDMIPLLPLALVLGSVYYYYRSYLAVVTAHALFNGAMLAMALVNVSGS